MSAIGHTARVPGLAGARAVFTGRHGGRSRAPYNSLNLAHHVGDTAEDVEHNRGVLGDHLGVPLQFVEQVHSDEVLVLPARGLVPPCRADAMVTDRDDVALVIMVADCLPVLLSDPVVGVVGAAHAGRRGLLGGILQHTVCRMAALGAEPSRIRAAVGPGICGPCYEVPEPMHRDAVAVLPAADARTSRGTRALDLRAGAVQVLLDAGLGRSAIDAAYPCTREDESYFSYRRQASTGRSAGAIRRD